MKQIQQWLKDHNIGMKLISVVMAFLLWGVVISVTDPVASNTYSVKVDLTNQWILEEKGLLLVQGPGFVTITVESNWKTMSSFTKDSITCSAAVTESVEEGETTLRYVVDPGNTDVKITYSTPSVTIITEKIVTASVEADIMLTGEPEQNYFVDQKRLEPNIITLEGKRSAVEAVKSARVVYDISGRKESFSVGVFYELLDENGNVVDATTLDIVEPASLTLDVTMKMESSIPLLVNLTATDYLATDEVLAAVSPANITVHGPPEIVETLNAIELESIALKHVVESGQFDLRRSIRIPDGVTAAEGTPEEAVISITIPGYEHRTISITEANLPEDERFTYPENTYEILLFGRTEALDLVTPESLILTPVVPDGLEPGEVSVALNISTGVEGVTVLSKNSVIINMLEQTGEETDPDPDTEVEP